MRRFDEIAAGVGLGILVGVLVGLSNTPVVAGVVSVLVALLASFFGLSASGSDRAKLLRIASFGVFGVIGVASGVAARAHGWLSPPMAAQTERWVRAGFPPDQARALVAYETLGIVPTGATLVPAPRTTSTILFSGQSGSECNALLPSRFASPGDLAEAMRQAGGPWKALADALGGADVATKGRALRAAYGLVCPL